MYRVAISIPQGIVTLNTLKHSAFFQRRVAELFRPGPALHKIISKSSYFIFEECLLKTPAKNAVQDPIMIIILPKILSTYYVSKYISNF